MKKAVLTISKYLATFISLIALFNVALYLACSFDSKFIEANVRDTALILTKEGGIPVVFNALNVENDSFTDAVMINEAYSVDCQTPFVSALKARKNYRAGITDQEYQDVVGNWVRAWQDQKTGKLMLGKDDLDTIWELHNFVTGHNSTSIEYGRYWHGYLCYLRPLLVLFNISQIRFILSIAYCSMLAYFLYLLKHRFGSDISIIFGASLIGGGLLTAYFSLQASGNFLTLMVSAIVFAKWMDKIRDAHLFIFAVAVITNFFDFLTVPLACLGLIGALNLLKLRQEGKSWQYCCQQFIVSCVAWLLGYAATWFAKWFEYDLVLHENVSMVTIGLQQCLFRTSRLDAGNPIYNGKHIFLTVMIISRATLFAVITEGLLLWKHKFTVTMRGFNRYALPFLLLTPIPIAWYLVAASHTVVHYFFTYRLSLVFTLGLLLAVQEQFYGSTIPKLAHLHLTAPMTSPEQTAETENNHKI